MRKKVNFLAIFAAAMLCAVIAIPTRSHNSIRQMLTDTIGVTTVQAEDTDIASGTWGTCPWTIDANGVLTIGAGTGADSYFILSPWDSYKEQITAVKESGAVVLPSKSFGLFRRLKNAKTIDVSGIDTKNVTKMDYMFSDCSSLAALDLSSFNTQKVTDMDYMFSGCSSLAKLNLSSFDTQKVTSMYVMFSGCSSLAELDLSSFNTQNVTDMSNMFSGCSSLAKLNLSSFDTQKVTSMYVMFSGCSSLAELDLSSFNTQNVTDMSNMFSGCSSLAELDLSSFNTQNVTDMNNMFSCCSSLRELNLSSWNTQNVKYMYYIFDGCNNLRKLAFGENFKIPAFTNTDQMHLTYPMATESDVISDGKWGLDSETASKSYTSDELMSLGKTLGAIKGEWYAQKAPDGTTLSYSVLDSNGTLFFIRSADIVQDSGQGIVKSIDGDSYTGVIYPNIENANFSQSPLPGNSADESAIKAVKIIDEIHPTSTRNMFSGLENCVSMDLAKLDTSGVMDMRFMFSGCSSLAELDLSSFNTRQVTDMSGMFSGCSSLQ